MPIVSIHPQQITGNWEKGIALELHTTSSVPVGNNEFGHMQFETVRPPLAELLYKLKYRGDQEAAQSIIETAAQFLLPHRAKFDLMIPVPASTPRPVQPVELLAAGIGASVGLAVISCVGMSRPTPQLKAVTDPEQRKALLNGLYTVDPAYTRGKRILVFDDLFRSGSTLNAITDVLRVAGGAISVSVLTITRTRSNR